MREEIMNEEEIMDEIVTKLSSLEPNKVVSLSDAAGKHLLKTIKEMQENGEI